MRRKLRVAIPTCVGILLIAILLGALLPHRRDPRRITFETLQRLWIGVEELYQKNGRLPSVEELTESIPAFMRDGDSVLDGWKREMVLLRGEKAFVFLSSGADGVLNTSDDMVSLVKPRGDAPFPKEHVSKK